MKFSVDRDVLADAVAWTARAVPTRPPTPVLAGVRIEAERGGMVRLASFDYEVSAKAEFAAQVENEGVALVSGRLLREIANALPHKPVVFSLDGTKVSVTCGASRFTLATMPVDQYPNLPELPEQSGTVDGKEFETAVVQVASAASRDETLPILTGVRVEIEGSNISLLATDRYRLGAARTQVEAFRLQRFCRRARPSQDARRNREGAGLRRRHRRALRRRRARPRRIRRGRSPDHVPADGRRLPPGSTALSRTPPPSRRR